MICDGCNGEGVIIYSTIDESYADLTCEKCAGTGKVDWIENVVGKKREFTGQFDDLLDSSAQVIAAQIDNEILETIQKEVEQINKIQTSTYMISLVRGCIF